MDKAREEAEEAYQKIVDEASDRKDAYVEKARLEAGEAIKPIGAEADKKIAEISKYSKGKEAEVVKSVVERIVNNGNS